MISLPRAWEHVADAPARDRKKFRDELLWQEYARHLYARVGARTGTALRHEPARAATPWEDPWPRDMACVDLTVSELERDGWLVNQTRMWLASQYVVRAGHDWPAGEDRFFAHLLDGSRAANRLGWQWTIGSGTGRPYGFSRSQVHKRAPGLCSTCALRDACPIERWPDGAAGARVDPPEGMRADPDPERTAGPAEPMRAVASGAASVAMTTGDAVDAVWLTAESLGDGDPALRAHPDLPAVFVFDERRLARWRLSGKRLVFLTETLADLATRRPVEVHLGDPAELLAGRRLAVTFTPVPGWRKIVEQMNRGAWPLYSPGAPASRLEVHPWPWLRRPHGASAQSFSAWVRQPGAART